MFADDMKSEVLEPGHHIRQRKLVAAVENFEPQRVGGHFPGLEELHRDLLIVRQTVEKIDIVNRGARIEMGLIADREGLAVVIQHRQAFLVPPVLDHGFGQVVTPIVGEGGYLRFQVATVHLQVAIRADAHDEMRSRQAGFGKNGGELGLGSIQGLLEQRFGPLANLGPIVIPGKIDQAVDELLVRVRTYKEADPTSLVDAPDADQDVIELILAGIEQLLARVTLHDLAQHLAVMGRGIQTGTLEHPIQLPAHQRDIEGALGVDTGSVQPHKTVLAHLTATVVKILHQHIVAIGIPVNPGPLGRFGQIDKGIAVEKVPESGRETG